MRLTYLYISVFAAGMLAITACSCNNNKQADKPVIIKGLYSFGPEVKSIRECGHENEFWVTDSSAQLELQYSQLNFEKPYEPVYIEVEGIKKPSDKVGLGSDFDTTLVVHKLIKITKEIPLETCR
ncbi:MAG: hypothetical protein EOP47_21590 [Sphingobacteriaceae bacterium]|nr:MAG: hypothetical protein EOP47_21590 [Sphingobacteriaceae bacterium]